MNKKISLEDAVTFASLMRECGEDKEADKSNPNWRMDLLSIVKAQKGKTEKE